MAIAPTEADWNRVLFERFYGPEMAGRPVYLSVDDEVLGSIAKEHEWDLADPAGSLVKAISTYLVIPQDRTVRKGDRIWTLWLKRANSWWYGKTEGIPPFIHVLAVTVLPATTRRVEEGHGYYRPLRRVLGLPPGEKEFGGYDDVPELWRILREWLLAQEGRFGLPSAVDEGGPWGWVGHSISQAMVRGEDRSTIISFFEQAGYRPGDDVDGDLLLRRFESWLIDSAEDQRLLERLSEKGAREALKEILRQDLRTWTGERRDSQFRRVIRIYPRLDASRRLITAVVDRPEGFDGAKDVDGGWIVEPGGGRDHARVAIALRGAGTQRVHLGAVAAELHDPSVHALVADDELGGYVGVDRGPADEPVWLLVRSGLSAVHRELELKGHPGTEWSRNWVLYKQVSLGQFIRGSVPPELRKILPPSGARASLWGGLALGRSTFLSSGAPDLIVPPSPVPLGVTLDGERVANVPAETERLRLSPSCSAIGPHELQVGDQTFRFTLVERSQSSDHSGTIAHILKAMPPTLLTVGEPHPGDEVVITGLVEHTSASSLPDVRELRPSVDGYLLLGPKGEREPVAPTPAWVRRIGQSACRVELEELSSDVTFRPAFVARLTRTLAEIEPYGATVQGDRVRSVALPEFGDRAVAVPRSVDATWRDWVRVHGKSATAPIRNGRLVEEKVAVPSADDQMLEWCSERSTGKLDVFIETYQWMCPGVEKQEALRCLTRLARLGHVEIEWADRKWSTNPAALLLPRHAGGLAFHCGRRPRSTVESLENLAVTGDTDISIASVPQPGRSGPALLVVRSGSRSSLRAFAEASGLPVFIAPEAQLAKRLPTLDAMITRKKIPRGFERRRLRVEPHRAVFEEMVDANDESGGCYEHLTFGPNMYSISTPNDKGNEYLVDRSTAIWHGLRAARCWPGTFDTSTRELRVETGFTLPMMHERAAIASSCTLPAREPGTPQYLCYHNVAAEVYESIRKALT